MMGEIFVIVVKRMLSDRYHFPHKSINNCRTNERLMLPSRTCGYKKMCVW
jgi:hypothetical protein